MLPSRSRWLLLLAFAACPFLGCESDPADKQIPPLPKASPVTAEGEPGDSAKRAPDIYQVKFETTKGDFVVEVDRSWAPRGADRFYELVNQQFYDGNKFFRVVKGFMVQFGIHGDPGVSRKWRDARIRDDEVKKSNTRGFITFATSGPNSRTTQVFINFENNQGLDQQGFSPFGRVIEGMEVVDSLYGEYGEAPSQAQQRIQEEGNVFLVDKFPKLDTIKTARIVGGPDGEAPAKGDEKDAAKPEGGAGDAK
ncbi:MAG: peptidylprolyl isomerase [Planctomycetaceae bacterium]|nr:peptidylprolyl isomerase [Planctomycetaceae bacterium]